MVNWDTCPGENFGSPIQVTKESSEAAKKSCVQQGCGGFVAWQGRAFLRRRPAAELLAMARYSPGTTLWLPAWELAAVQARGSGASSMFHLVPSLPEVVIPGARPVEKKAGLSEAEMTERFMRSQPVVLTDAQEGWPARDKWTFQWLGEHFGDEEMPVSDLAPFFKSDRGTIQTVKLSMREYTRYVLSEPNGLRVLHKSEGQVFYGNGWCPFYQYGHLLDDVSDRLYCVSDGIPRGEGPAKEFNAQLTKVFLGPAGTVSRLHHDTYATHVWLSQIRGRKQFICYPPDDHENLYGVSDDLCDGRISHFDPAAPDYKAFPKARSASAYSVIVEEGETVVLPARWWHWAKSLTPSITLMRNFVNEVNLSEHVTIRQRAAAAKQGQ